MLNIQNDGPRGNIHICKMNTYGVQHNCFDWMIDLISLFSAVRYGVVDSPTKMVYDVVQI